MSLAKIQLTQFRNYTDRVFSFSPELTIIAGKNTAGKTSILEAISLISSGRSFRAEREREMIHKDYEVGRSKVQTYSSTDSSDVLEAIVTTGFVQGKKAPYKTFKLNGNNKRATSIIGYIPSVLFCPEDLDLITGSPSRRRRYVDTVLSQSHSSYRRALLSYEKALRIRNKLLKMIREGVFIKRDELEYWEDRLIEHGSLLHDMRASYIEYINLFTPADHGSIMFTADYDHSIVSRERIEQYAAAERGAGVTLVGPHRDDIVIYLGPRVTEHGALKNYGSRGQQRLGVLWMKLAELAYIAQHHETAPVLLLDDILSELDDGHRHLVFDVISRQQTIMTTADTSVVPAHIITDSQMIELTS